MRYIPRNDSAFCDWADNVLTYAAAHCERWGVMAPDAGMADRLNDLKAKVERCKDATRSKVDTLLKNEARRAVEKDFRNYVQGVVVRNIRVSDEDRKMMALPIYDRTPTPVGDPVGLVTAAVKYLNEGALELNIKHVKGSPYDARANYGVKIRYAVTPIDAPPVTDVGLMQDSRFTRRKKETFIFEKHDRKKRLISRCDTKTAREKQGSGGKLFRQ